MVDVLWVARQGLTAQMQGARRSRGALHHTRKPPQRDLQYFYHGLLGPVPGVGSVVAQVARAGGRIDIGAKVIGVTGSVGKTSTKDLIASLIRPYRKVVASHENYNTEIGVPLMILSASRGTEVLVLELAARDFGQIAELAEMCLPDVGVVTRIAPAHLEQFGSLEGVAKVKGELFECLPDGATAIAPSGETRLRPYLRSNLNMVTFGLGGDVDFNRTGVDGG